MRIPDGLHPNIDELKKINPNSMDNATQNSLYRNLRAIDNAIASRYGLEAGSLIKKRPSLRYFFSQKN